MVRTSGFHPLNRGSIPRSATKKFQNTGKGVFLFGFIDEEMGFQNFGLMAEFPE